MRVLGWLANSIGTLALVGCGATQIEVMGKEEQPQRPPPRPVPVAHHSGSLVLPSQAAVVETTQPAVESAQERALAHVYGARPGVCSGVVVAPRVVVTAHECVDGRSARNLRVEVATSTLTWAERDVYSVVLPACGWQKLDLAALVLSEPVDPFVKPLHVVAAPPAGARVQALGFGHCAGEAGGLSSRFGHVVVRDGEDLVVDLPLCNGDEGGPLVDTATSALLGLVSHHPDPDSEADTTIFTRLDTTPARALVAKAEAVGRGAADREGAIACE
jgi:hypothetical protein